MAHSDSDSHQPLLYLEVCCHPFNRGKSLKIQDEMSHINYILCPSTPPMSCPIFSSYSQLHYPNALSGYYNIMVVRLKCAVIWRVVTVMEREVEQEWDLLI